ncbi:MAG TPA: M1 family metallopeptidase [Lentimicrobium sp.]|nr:M1 family metallopeptidase [Lentimicrobium sp.]
MRVRILLQLAFSLMIMFPFDTIGQEKMIIPKKNIAAFNKQTRQNDGNPGKNYWQNSSDYNIRVEVDVKNKKLLGTEQITYHNNSPDTIKSIVIRLYQDLFKKGANRNSMVPVDPLDVHEGVNIGSLSVNGIDFDKSRVKRQGTIMVIPLKEKLAPANKVEIDISWDFKFPEHTLIRMGTIDSTSLFVAQWYPQVAVYDDIYGWDTRSYNGMSEFYNDFGNFEVDITVPEGFIVWATGEPLNLDEVLQPEIFERYKKASSGNEIINVITPADLKKGNLTTSNHTWQFKAGNVSDFAFGLSDHYLWDVTSVEVEKASKRRTIVASAYNETAVHFNKVAKIARETVRFLSEEVPGIPYPFPYITAFHGDFGMEYPMITNVGPDEDYGTTVYAHSHEIAHAYFPFLVGTNETKNGWLDEGLVVFMPEKVQTQMEPTFNVAKNNTAAFSAYSGMEDEVALITPTFYLDPKIYFYLNYAKTEQALRMLEMEIGADLFKECLQTFIERWKYKHPTPIDFFNTFNDVSKQDLNWYWQAWYYQNGGIPDLSISDVSKTDKTLTITIENKGDLPLPAVISFYNNDKLVHTITEPGNRWKEQNTLKVTFDQPESITTIRLGNEIIPDANRKDNEYKLL